MYPNTPNITLLITTQLTARLFAVAGSAMTIILLLASLNSCTNPWIYLIFTDNLCAYLSKCCGRKARTPQRWSSSYRTTNTTTASGRVMEYSFKRSDNVSPSNGTSHYIPMDVRNGHSREQFV